MSFFSKIYMTVFVALMLACGGEESTALPDDCRTQGQDCSTGRSCQPDTNGNYVCIPETQGGSAGEVGPNGGTSGDGGSAGQAGNGGFAGQSNQGGSGGLAGNSGSGGQAGEAGNNGQAGIGGQAGSEPPFCGDGVQNGSEACDDGNEIDDDACSNDCEINEPPIDPPTGPYSLTFNVRMEPGYTGGVTVGNNLQGWNTPAPYNSKTMTVTASIPVPCSSTRAKESNSSISAAMTEAACGRMSPQNVAM